MNPAFNPDRDNVRFNYTQYGSGANAIKNFADARNVFKTYSELKPNQKGYENFRNYQKALSYKTGISEWGLATDRELFEAIDNTFRGYQEDNQKENFKFGVWDAAKLAAAAAATYFTAGAAAPLFGPSAAGTVATGALAGAAGATTSGVLNDNLSLEGVATGALVGGALGGGEYYFRPDYVNPSALGLGDMSSDLLYSSAALREAPTTFAMARNAAQIASLGGSIANVFPAALPATGANVLSSMAGSTAGYGAAGSQGVLGGIGSPLPLTGAEVVGVVGAPIAGYGAAGSRGILGIGPPSLDAPASSAIEAAASPKSFTNAAALGITPTDVFGALPPTGAQVVGAPIAEVNAAGSGPIDDLGLGITPTDVYRSSALREAPTGVYNSVDNLGLGITPTNVFGALPPTGAQVVGTPIAGLNSAGLYTPGLIAGLNPTGAVVPRKGILSGIGDLASEILSPKNLFLASAGAPPPELAESGKEASSDSIASTVIQGVGSLASADHQPYVDPTPYLGRMALDPAFMNQFERAEFRPMWVPNAFS